jgi:cell division protein ZapB
MRMSTIDLKGSAEQGLDALEARVDELIRTVERLSQENRSLHARQKSLMAERAELIDKTDMARTRVESMINRLKSMEVNL